MTTKLALTQSAGFRNLSRDRADNGRQNHGRQHKLHRLGTYVHDGDDTIYYHDYRLYGYENTAIDTRL